MSKVRKNVLTFALVAFLLLGVLFGMQIMAFMFGNLSVASISTATADTLTQTNRSGAYINATPYTIPEASDSNFLGSFAVVTAYNATDGSVIGSGNYTVDATAGTITNATATNYANVNLTYTYSFKSQSRQATEETTNNSLQGIVSYTNQSTTQFNVAAIAITLAILIGLFVLVWSSIIRPMISNKSAGSFS